MDGEMRRARVTGPLGQPVDAEFGFVMRDRLAFLDTASAAGLALVSEAQRDVMRATSFGVGELIRVAIQCGVHRMVVGVGGSACNDGGCGMAQALGVRFLDSNGHYIEAPMAGADLLRIAAIDTSQVSAALSDIEITVACDVANPLTGRNGAAHVYAAQKGANETQIGLLDRGLENLAAIVRRDLGIEIEDRPRCGAAGGLAAGLFTFAGWRRSLPIRTHRTVQESAPQPIFSRPAVKASNWMTWCSASNRWSRRRVRQGNIEDTTVRLESRLRSLERFHGPGPRECPVCMGNGKLVISTVQEHDPEPQPEGCPHCGEVRHIIVRQVRIDKIEW
jgi:hypothetical protein